MYDTEHHYDFCLLSSVLECFPGKALDHASDAAGIAIVSCHKSGGSPLDSFYLFDVHCFSITLTKYFTRIFYRPEHIFPDLSYTVSQYFMTLALMAVRQEVNNFESSVIAQELEFAMNIALYHRDQSDITLCHTPLIC